MMKMPQKHILMMKMPLPKNYQNDENATFFLLSNPMMLFLPTGIVSN